MATNTSNTKEIYEVKGTITALLNRLAVLPAEDGEAPVKAPQYLYKNDNLKPATEADSMLGMLLVETFLGGAFNLSAGFAANDNPGTSGIQSTFFMAGPDELAEIYSEYLQNRAEKADDKRGKGTYALDGSKTIRCPFNEEANKKDKSAQAASPARLAIEKSLAQALRELEILTAQKAAPPTPLAA